MTVNEPLSYEPAGSIVVILSLVPMVSVPPPPEPPLSLLPPPHAVSASAVTAMPDVAASRRRPLLETEFIRYLVFVEADRRRSERPQRPPVAVGDHMPSTQHFRGSGPGTCCYPVVTGQCRCMCASGRVGPLPAGRPR